MAFDLSAARAAQREAAGKSKFTFVLGDDTYTVEPSKFWPVDTAQMLADGKIAEAIRLILGPDTWAAIGEVLTLGDCELLLSALTDYEGLGDDAGNLSARSSPAGTRKPKRTSSGSTG